MDEQNQNQFGAGPANVPPVVSQPAVNRSNLPNPPVTEPSNPRKSKFWKFVAWFVAIVIVAAAGLWAIGDYQYSEGIKAFEKWAEDTKRATEEFEARKAADTFGGATPQETLRVYIEAVEKGDYELASKYFVFDRQEKELRSLTNSPPDNVVNVTRLLREALNNEGSYSADRKEFAIRRPILVDFILYPSGLWKIVEI
ncbi:MAG: hypothetical protein HYU81_00960 [Candidatus Brennerbacteria bacterium]|nr:hypothetical protein [Candidatus Brennerbacteria bacterium]